MQRRLVAAVGVLTISCYARPDTLGDDCRVDADCDNGQVCADDVCTAPPATNTSTGSGSGTADSSGGTSGSASGSTVTSGGSLSSGGPASGSGSTA